MIRLLREVYCPVRMRSNRSGNSTGLSLGPHILEQKTKTITCVPASLAH